MLKDWIDWCSTLDGKCENLKYKFFQTLILASRISIRENFCCQSWAGVQRTLFIKLTWLHHIWIKSVESDEFFSAKRGTLHISVFLLLKWPIFSILPPQTKGKKLFLKNKISIIRQKTACNRERLTCTYKTLENHLTNINTTSSTALHVYYFVFAFHNVLKKKIALYLLSGAKCTLLCALVALLSAYSCCRCIYIRLFCITKRKITELFN